MSAARIAECVESTSAYRTATVPHEPLRPAERGVVHRVISLSALAFFYVLGGFWLKRTAHGIT